MRKLNLQADSNGNKSHKTNKSPAKSSQHKSTSSTSTAVDSWYITLNQFIATTLPVSKINAALSKRSHITDSIERLQKNRRKCVV